MTLPWLMGMIIYLVGAYTHVQPGPSGVTGTDGVFYCTEPGCNTVIFDLEVDNSSTSN